ncbi:MAG: amidohydrolase family protein [Phycisphaerae bacterium]
MIIDVNVSLGVWPFQRFQIRTAAQLDRRLASHGIGQAWVSSAEAILQPDVDGCDEELYSRLRPYPRLRMVKTLNPVLANWPASLDRWSGRGVDAVKVHPGYHQYSPASPAACELARQVAARRMTLLVQMRVEDERGMYPPLHVRGVPVDELVKLAGAVPEASIIALCPYLREAVELVKRTRNVLVDLAFIETCDTLRTFLRDAPAGRVVFGSHTPFLCTGAELMKLTAANARRQDLKMVRETNARRLVQHRQVRLA